MNLDTAKRLILLEQSGELSRRKRRRLARFLAQSEEARSFKAELTQLTRLAKSGASSAVPDFTMHRIKSEARQATAQPAQRPLWRRAPAATFAWRPALVYATLSLLVAAGGLLLLRAQRATPLPAPVAAAPNQAVLAWEDDFDEQIADLGDMMASLSDDETTTDLDSLAAELLEMEGSQI